jgi:DNA mismatch repair protein MLH3
MSVPNSRGDYVFDLKRIESIFTQSGLINPRNWHHWHELSASIPDLTVRGAISLQPSPTRKIQFISLGKEPVLSRNNSNILYNQINRIFSLSDFANSGVASDCSSTPNPVYSVDRNDAPSNASTRSWARPINKWPMFYIRIEARTVLQLDGEGQEHFPESDKSIRRILDVLGAMLHEFLKQHKMRPQSVKRQTLSSDRTQTELAQGSKPAGVAQGSLRRGHSLSSTEEAFSTCLKIPSFPRPQSVDSSQGFANWSRVKAAKELKGRSPNHRPPRFYQDDSDIDQVGVVLPTCADLESDSPNYGRDITTSSMLPNSTIDGDNQNRMEEHARDVPPDEMITWIDPHTKMAYPINPRTGQKMNSRRSLATQRFSLAKGKDASSNHPAQGLWIENILGTWDNPSFGRTEMPISNMEPESAAQRAFNNPHGVFRGIGSLDTAQVAKYRGKLRRRGLEAAEVIAQVDKKFILAKVPTAAMTTSASETSNGVLVLVDQHAADERCRIEQLFREMFLSPDRTAEPGNGVRTVQVFIKFEVSETEGNLFHKYTTLFSNWGIQYDTEVKPESIVLITVHTLPVLIAERCRVEPQVLIDLIRREIWSSEGNGGKPFQRRRNFETPYDDQDLEQLYSEDEAQRQKQPTTSPDSHSWVRKLNGCPQGIIDLLNSRACRTAIMFNDPLNIQECQALVFRLARCAFPFQCAHGRPSMIPILDLRSLSDSAASLPLNLDTSTYSDENDGMDLDFMEAFRTHYT